MTTASNRSRGLWLIAAFKLFKALLLLVAGLGLLRLVHRSVADEILRLADILHVDPNNRYFYRLLARASLFNDRRLRELSAGTFFYSALFFTEGIGLFLRRAWAEYLTIIETASFMPLEIYEMTRRFTFPRVLTLVINIAVMIYLFVEIRAYHRGGHRPRRRRSN